MSIEDGLKLIAENKTLRNKLSNSSVKIKNQERKIDKLENKMDELVTKASKKVILATKSKVHKKEDNLSIIKTAKKRSVNPFLAIKNIFLRRPCFA